MSTTWDDLPRAQWEAFHAAQPAALQQSWAYGEALLALGVRVHRAMVWQDGRLLAVAQFMCRRIAGYLSLASCTRGPVWLADVLPEQRAHVYRLLRRDLPVPRLKVVLFSPDRTASEVAAAETRGLSRVMSGYATVYLDLSATQAGLKAQLEGKWRNRLNKALSHEKIRWQVQASVKRCEWLLTKELDQREAKKFHGLPTAFVSAYLAAHADPRQAFVVAYAELGKNTIGAQLFLIHGQVASYHVGWSSEEGRQWSTHNALLWKAMVYLQESGVKVLDLGGVNTHDLPGISRFKLGTGGRAVRLAGTYF